MARLVLATVAVALLQTGLQSSSTRAQCSDPLERLFDDGFRDQGFGDVVVDGEVAAVRTFEFVYLYRFDGVDWLLEQKFSPPFFANAVALQGDTLMIGRSYFTLDTGSVLVYRYDGFHWQGQQRLLASDRAVGDEFGWRVDIDGDRALVAAPYKPVGNGSGVVYVFWNDGTQWVEEARLYADSPVRSSRFGESIDLDGDTAAIGSPYESAGGATYVFQRGDAGWTLHSRLVSETPNEEDLFGHALSLEDDRLLVSLPLSKEAGKYQSGAVEAFTFDGVDWNRTQRLLPFDAQALDQFGGRIARSKGVALVVAERNDGSNQYSGKVYRYRLQQGDWVEEHVYLSQSGDPFDQFGASIAVDSDLAWIDAANGDGGGEGTGVVMAFSSHAMTLHTEGRHVPVGDPITLTTCDGQPGGLGVLFAVEVDGTSILCQVATGHFDANGQWSVSSVAPPDVAGLLITFQSVGAGGERRAVLSNQRGVQFH